MLIITAATFMMLFTQVAVADQITGTVTIYESSYSKGGGGEFTAKVSSSLEGVLDAYADTTKNVGNHDPSIQTFCLETDEYVSSGVTYIATIKNNIAMGGGTNSNTGDQISKGTAYLYYQFVNGKLAEYKYADDPSTPYVNERSVTAGILQQAIWYLENETNSTYVTTNDSNWQSNIFLAAIIGEGKMFASVEAARANSNGAYGIMVLNLTSYDRYGNLVQNQDMLAATPTPIPAAAWLFASGLIGLTAIRRRKIDGKLS